MTTTARPTRGQGSQPAAGPRLSPRLVRWIVQVVFVLGIAGMIVASIAESTGSAITFGLITAVAALGLVLVTSVSPPGSLSKKGSARPIEVDERLAADVEARIDALVDDGADEEAVRKLVGRAVEMGRQSA
jgi:hypothetical protein